MLVSDFIRGYARERGVISSGIHPILEKMPGYEFFKNSLESGFLDGLDWLKRNKRNFLYPEGISKNFHSSVFFLFNYYSKEGDISSKSVPRISRYAQFLDYHRVIRSFLSDLSLKLKENFGINSRYFVDSSPFLERSMALHSFEEAFMGWNGLLFYRNSGSFFFIGEMVLDFKSPPLLFKNSNMSFDGCDGCSRCVKSCPTGAIVSPGVVDTRKCISYHTIENRGVIPREICEKMSGFIFGCDICQEVCPLNFRLKDTEFKGFNPLEKIVNFDLEEFVSLSKNQFFKKYGDTAFRRAGFYIILRNLFILSELGFIDSSYSKKIFNRFKNRKEIRGQFLEMK